MIAHINRKRILKFSLRKSNTYKGFKWTFDDENSNFFRVEVRRCSNNELWTGLYYPTRLFPTKEDIDLKQIHDAIDFYLKQGM